jgi:hypothetical protein
MPQTQKLVRVQLPNGSEATLGEGFAERRQLKILEDQPATVGRSALPESHENTKAKTAKKEADK